MFSQSLQVQTMTAELQGARIAHTYSQPIQLFITAYYTLICTPMYVIIYFEPLCGGFGERAFRVCKHMFCGF